MKELTDYSGDFDPDLRFEDFSKETLVSMLGLYSRMLVTLDGFWYLAVKERVGNEEATECDLWAWEKELKYMVDDIKEVLGINGEDVVDFMKVVQARPFHFTLEEKIEVLTPSAAVHTVTHCPTLLALEKEGEGRDATHCDSACTVIRRKYAELFNPDIEVKCLKMPPRKSRDDIFCQWEYTLG